jgi:hypothetical protein
MFHTRVTAQKRIGPHNLDVISVLVGSLLGDCYASKRSPGVIYPLVDLLRVQDWFINKV